MKSTTQFRQAVDNYENLCIEDNEWLLNDITIAIAEDYGINWTIHPTKKDYQRLMTLKRIIIETLTFSVVQEEIKKQIDFILFPDEYDEEE